MAHNYVTSLRVVDADGVDKKDEFDNPVTIGSNIVLQSGINMDLGVNDDNEIELAAGAELGENDSTTQQKFTDIVEGNPPFSGAPYWISTMHQASTTDGAFFFSVDRCFHLGQFLDYEVPDTPNLLSLLDTCPACNDCPEYDDLQTHITTVVNAIDVEKNTIQNSEGVLDQYTALLQRWNYVVHLKSWRFNAEATGSEVHASCKYTNHTTAVIPAGLVMQASFADVPTATKVFVIDTAVLGTIQRTDLVTAVTGGDLIAQLTTTAPLEPGDGIRFYAGSLSPY